VSTISVKLMRNFWLQGLRNLLKAKEILVVEA
jgi:hypothetical protein